MKHSLLRCAALIACVAVLAYPACPARSYAAAAEYVDSLDDAQTPVPNTPVPHTPAPHTPVPDPDDTPAPTPVPTAAPTPTPVVTAPHTGAPTSDPTPGPTSEHTPEPTLEPTPEPTLEPTPTPRPKRTPTPRPRKTAKPTAKPTEKTPDEPTEAPTDMPTDAPDAPDETDAPAEQDERMATDANGMAYTIGVDETDELMLNRLSYGQIAFDEYGGACRFRHGLYLDEDGEQSTLKLTLSPDGDGAYTRRDIRLTAAQAIALCSQGIVNLAFDMDGFIVMIRLDELFSDSFAAIADAFGSAVEAASYTLTVEPLTDDTMTNEELKPAGRQYAVSDRYRLTLQMQAGESTSDISGKLTGMLVAFDMNRALLEGETIEGLGDDYGISQAPVGAENPEWLDTLRVDTLLSPMVGEEADERPSDAPYRYYCAQSSASGMYVVALIQ